MAKLSMLVFFSGILPLAVIAAWTIAFQIRVADNLAARTNHEIALNIRDESERHELLLKYWATQIDPVALDHEKTQVLLDTWTTIPGAFKALEIRDADQVQSQMPPLVLAVFRQTDTAFYDVSDPDVPTQQALRAVVRLPANPDKALTGICIWRPAIPLIEELFAGGYLVVIAADGSEIYRSTPPQLADWCPDKTKSVDQPYKIRHNQQSFHVAEARLPRLGLRFVRLIPTKTGTTTVLASIPNTIAILVNFAIFVSLIAGNALAGRISKRVLAIADHVQQAGPEPGALNIPIRGRDELGYLGRTLNHMSGEMAEYIRKLQIATAEKERLAAELELARQVQMSILPPEPPTVGGYEFAAYSNPAREVGGDFYDVFVQKDGRIVLMIGDAAGKGLKAAIYITQTHALARAATLDQATPDMVLTAVNASMASVRRPPSEFVTMFCAILDSNSHKLSYASAGHNPPILLREGRIEHLRLGGTPLALPDPSGYDLYEAALEVGDVILFYTDGLTDAVNSNYDLFGAERLKALLQQSSGSSSAKLADQILNALSEFTTDAPQSDDITFLILHRTG